MKGAGILTTERMKGDKTMTIYNTRYQAKKYCKSNEKIVKVCGGYVIMTYSEYEIWKNQK